MSTQSTAVAVKAPATIQQLIQTPSFKEKVALSLPKHLSPDRFARVALLAINRTPKLAQCTQSSLLQCLYDLSAVGLEPDGRRAHLIPYKDKCTLILDYKGIVELVRRSGDVSDLHADVICENDEFSYVFGTGSHLKHKIDLRKPRGAVIGAYSYVRLKDGSDSFEVLQKDEIEAVRKRSMAGNSGPWVSDWNEMAKKTAFRRHSKWLPLSPELRDALEKEDETPALSPEARADMAKPVFGSVADIPAEATPAQEPTPEPAQATEQAAAQPNPDQPATETVAEQAPADPTPASSNVDKLQDLMLDNDVNEHALLKWAAEAKHIPASITSVTKIPEAKAAIFVNNWTKVLGGIRGEAAK